LSMLQDMPSEQPVPIEYNKIATTGTDMFSPISGNMTNTRTAIPLFEDSFHAITA